MPLELTPLPAFLPDVEPKRGFSTFNALQDGEWFIALAGPLHGHLCRKNEWGYHTVKVYKNGKLENRGGGISDGADFPVLRANPTYCDWE